MKKYIYKVINEQGRFEDYSGEFKTKEDAIKWYEQNGKYLEEKFNRTLYLFP